MAGIITYAMDRSSSLTAACKNRIWYHPVLLFDEIGKDGDFTKPLRYKIEKTNEQILFHGYARVSHLTVDQQLKKRWRKIIRQVEAGQEPERLMEDLYMICQPYYKISAITRSLEGRRIKFQRFIPYPTPRAKVLERVLQMLKVRRDGGRYFIGDVIQIRSPMGFDVCFLLEQESNYEGTSFKKTLTETGHSGPNEGAYKDWT